MKAFLLFTHIALRHVRRNARRHVTTHGRVEANDYANKISSDWDLRAFLQVVSYVQYSGTKSMSGVQEHKQNGCWLSVYHVCCKEKRG